MAKNGKKSEEVTEAPKETSSKTVYDNSKWSKPHERAKGYAEERKHNVHAVGKKQGQPLTEFEAGLRSGYLQSQHDHAGFWKYKQAIGLGYSKEEAAAMSKLPWKKNTPRKKKKGA